MSELNMDAERAAFEAWIGLNDREGPQADRYEDTYTDNYVGEMWEAWQASAKRRAAPVGEVELPALPEPLRFAQWTGGEVFAYTAEQVRQAQREAIEADRAARAQQQAQSIGDDPKVHDMLLRYGVWPPDDVSALIAHIDGRTAGAAPAWQPIETAPANMAPRLYRVGGFCVQGFVDAAGELMVQSEVSPHWRKMRGEPTHWMQLPAAPSPQPGKEEA